MFVDEKTQKSFKKRPCEAVFGYVFEYVFRYVFGYVFEYVFGYVFGTTST